MLYELHPALVHQPMLNLRCARRFQRMHLVDFGTSVVCSSGVMQEPRHRAPAHAVLECSRCTSVLCTRSLSARSKINALHALVEKHLYLQVHCWLSQCKQIPLHSFCLPYVYSMLRMLAVMQKPAALACRLAGKHMLAVNTSMQHTK